jgi:hypothetical protein
MISPARDTVLLEWASRFCPKGAAAMRAAASPEEKARVLDKLDGLHLTWMFNEMTTAKGWDQQGVSSVLKRADQLEAEAQAPRDAARNAFVWGQDARRQAA